MLTFNNNKLIAVLLSVLVVSQEMCASFNDIVVVPFKNALPTLSVAVAMSAVPGLVAGANIGADSKNKSGVVLSSLAVIGYYGSPVVMAIGLNKLNPPASIGGYLVNGAMGYVAARVITYTSIPVGFAVLAGVTHDSRKNNAASAKEDSAIQ